MTSALQLKKAAILKGLAHPVRMSIVETLAEKEMCVCQITEMFHFDRTTISKHLAFMKSLGILADRKEGLNVFYRLRIRCLASLLSCVEKIAAGENSVEMFSGCGCIDLDSILDREGKGNENPDSGAGMSQM